MAVEKDVVVVSIDNYSWNILINKKYFAFPKGTRKIGEYFAFYKKEPISAVTHYAKVLQSQEGDKKDVGIGYWLNCFPDSQPPYVIVRFDKIKKLKQPVRKDNLGRGKGHVQGRIYTSLNKLLKAKTISQLA